jgi:hypothetical protein
MLNIYADPMTATDIAKARSQTGAGGRLEDSLAFP